MDLQGTKPPPTRVCPVNTRPAQLITAYKGEQRLASPSTAVRAVAQHTGSGALAQAMAWGPVSRLRQGLQKLSPHAARCTQGKPVSGYRGDQLIPPSLKINYAWLNNHSCKCSSLTSESASLFRAPPRAPAQGPSRGPRTAGAQSCPMLLAGVPGLAAGWAPHLLRPFGRSHSDSISPVVPLRSLAMFSCFPTFFQVSL